MKAGKAFKAIGLLLRKPWMLNLILENDQVWQQYLERKYGNLTRLPEIPFSFVCGNTGHLGPFASLDGGSLPTDLLLLRSLAASFASCRYFEIGTWRGESASNVAHVAHHCTTLNLSREAIIARGGSNAYANEHFRFLKGKKNIRLIEADSKNFDFSTLYGPFDLVFIDGDHHYESIFQDTRNVFRHVAHEDSIVVWHDYGRNPETVRPEVLAAILDALPPEKHDALFHVSHTLCAVYAPAIKKSFSEHSKPAERGSFNIELRWEPDITEDSR
ncbi:MAG TPA: class I SAM-dependent methyltransferase [Bacteroidales bacterium]|nr:class I SAM-dependent methyltransferase [Bacteroidales bacterium]HSA43322.1 class I SAM-dependent methyltransferase [Bacteroidales bacterium]